MTWNVFIKISLNPFGTGQCLSTVDNIPPASELSVSIPLEQGSVFRQLTADQDSAKVWVSIPLEQGSVFRQLTAYQDSAKVWVSIPLEQGSVFRQ